MLTEQYRWRIWLSSIPQIRWTSGVTWFWNGQWQTLSVNASISIIGSAQQSYRYGTSYDPAEMILLWLWFYRSDHEAIQSCLFFGEKFWILTWCCVGFFRCSAIVFCKGNVYDFTTNLFFTMALKMQVLFSLLFQSETGLDFHPISHPRARGSRVDQN